MKLSELKLIIDRGLEFSPQDDPEVVIKIKLPYSSVVGTPRVAASTAWFGFDWDAGKFFIVPAEDLTPSDRDFAKQMADMQERAAHADRENRSLKAENKRLRDALAKAEGKE